MSPTPPLRPLTLTDSEIFELVYQNYVANKAGENFDVDSLFSVVSDIMSPLVDAAEPSIKTDEECKATNIEPPVQTLKNIACQMMCTAQDESHSYAHVTTMSILEQLTAYSWDAKAVIALAAFSLEYGNVWHLSQVPKEDDLGRSLALLNHVQAFETDTRAISEYNLLVKNVFEAVKSIIELERMFKQGFEEKDVPTLTEAMRDFPVFVYWVVLAIVACALRINFLSSYWEGKYELFNISSKISNVLTKLRALLGMIRKEIAQKEVHSPTEIVEVFLQVSE